MTSASSRSPGLSAVLSGYVGLAGIGTSVPDCGELEPEGVVAYASATPVVDGAHEAAWNPMAATEATRLLAGEPEGLASSLALSWRTAWDAQFLYVVATVYDNQLVEGESPEPWNDDSVEVFIDGAPRAGHGDYDRHDYHLLLQPGATEPSLGEHSARDLTGVRFQAARLFSYGYVVELAVPWQRLGVAPRPGALLGLDVHVNDDDDGGARDRKLATHAQADEASHDLTQLGVLALARSPTPGGELASVARAPTVDALVEPEVWSLAPARAIDQTLEGALATEARFRAVWDARALYVLAEVDDPDHHVDSRLPRDDDSLEVYLAAATGLPHGGYVFRFGDLTVRSIAGMHANTRGVRVASRADGALLRYELEIPWRALGLRPEPGRVLRLDVQVNDDDDGGRRDRKLARFAEVDQAWRDTSLLGRFVLVAGDAARFESLGDLAGGDVASFVEDVSASGEVVVGWSRGARGDEAVRRIPGERLQGLGGEASRALGVSPHGKLIAGSVADGSLSYGRAGGLFQASAPFAPLVSYVAYPGAPQMFEVFQPRVVLDDARALGACKQYGAYGELLGCRVDAPYRVTVPLGSEIFAADEAGNWAGTLYPPARYTPPFASVAMFNGATLGYPGPVPCIVPHDCRSEARDFSDGAAVVVGTSRVPRRDADPFEPEPVLVPAAFVYTQADGMVRLDELAGEEGSGAFAIDAAGRVIGGFGANESGTHALVWIDRQPARLEALFSAAGGTLPQGFVLRDVRALSRDGRTFVGNGENAAGAAEGYRIVLPCVP